MKKQGSTRNIRRECNDNIKNLKRQKISEDEKNFEEDVQKSTDDNISLIEKFYLRKKKKSSHYDNINHIAFIMDGNGRWGKKRENQEILVI